jgi:hypothetical protein
MYFEWPLVRWPLAIYSRWKLIEDYSKFWHICLEMFTLCHLYLWRCCHFPACFIVHGWKFTVFWLISVFLTKIQAVLEIRVNLMIFFRVWGTHFLRILRGSWSVLIVENFQYLSPKKLSPHLLSNNLYYVQCISY